MTIALKEYVLISGMTVVLGIKQGVQNQTSYKKTESLFHWLNVTIHISAEKTVNKKRIYVPISPQPAPENILEVNRMYQTLKASTQFKRRVTWFGNVPDSLAYLPANEAIVEYIGEFQERQLHGNVVHKEKNKPYIKTKPSVRKKIKKNS